MEQNLPETEEMMIPEEHQLGWKEQLKIFIHSRDFRQLAAAFICLVICIVYSGIALLWTDYKRPMDGVVEGDILHKCLPYFPNTVLFFNIIMCIHVFVCVAIIMFDKRRTIAAKRFMMIYTIVLTMRDISMSVTSFPDPSERCAHPKPTSFVVNPKTIFVAITGGLTCGDMIFSGHLIAFLVPCVIHTHFYANWVSLGLWANTFLGAFLIISSHFHYTVDCVLAILIVPLIGWAYNLIADNEKDFQDLPKPIAWFFRYMEWSSPYEPLEKSLQSDSENIMNESTDPI